MSKRRAIGIVRVSQVNGREGESFASPVVQRTRIKEACERDGLELITTHDELDVSGGKALQDRPGLREAVAAIEAGAAEVVVAAYFDRLFRSLKTQAEVIERVEAAGGQVLAVDVGHVTNGTAAEWLSGTMHGAMAEYFRRHVGEKSGEAVARSVARGVAPWPRIPAGYRRGADGVLVPDETAPTVAEAFKLRAGGATVREVREHLGAAGIAYSYHGTQSLLGSRVVLGEIHFGKLVNLAAHQAIVDRETWEAVQRAVVSRGRRGKSDRLLARLGILRCGSCGSRMVVGTSHHSKYFIYRCPPVGDCPRRQTISAQIVEEKVIRDVRERLAWVQARTSPMDTTVSAAFSLERAQAALDGAIRAFSGLERETAAVERLQELQRERDDARTRYQEVCAADQAIETATVAGSWDDLNWDERRALISASIERVTIRPGRGAERIVVHPAAILAGSSSPPR